MEQLVQRETLVQGVIQALKGQLVLTDLRVFRVIRAVRVKEV
jgi:hypothetical protein